MKGGKIFEQKRNKEKKDSRFKRKWQMMMIGKENSTYRWYEIQSKGREYLYVFKRTWNKEWFETLY